MTVLSLKVEEENDERKWREERLSHEIDECVKLRRYMKKFLVEFLVKNEIWDIEEMDYTSRKVYEQYLAGRVAKQQILVYLLIYDRVRQSWIRKQVETLQGRRKCQWIYKNEVLFIPYHPDENAREAFDTARNKECVVWDFSIPCSEILKRQIFLVVNKIIGLQGDSYYRLSRLKGLKHLYQFCYRNDISDIEKMELDQITDFYEYVEHSASSKIEKRNSRAVLDYARREIFMGEMKIHWNANVWYLERINLQEHRKDESRMVRSLSFLEITQKENRRLFQEYMRYEIGISDHTLSWIKGKFSHIRRYLSAIDSEKISVKKLPPQRTEEYLKELDTRDLAPITYNIMVGNIAHFYYFLQAKRYIDKMPFEPAYYMKKVIPVHHNRSVEFEICQQILMKLKYFPEHLRIMYLHLWALGLRISEVCILKPSAYFKRGNDIWIRVYQVKMKEHKNIPIPEMLYQYVQVYVKRNSIGIDEYLFQDLQGEAFKYGTFVRQMKECCKDNGIRGEEYLFKSHDYRHTVATLFYEQGVSIQSIRDYLGHETEAMTEQYIDCIPQKIDEKNEEFFNQQENKLWIMERAHGKRQSKDIL